jgi:ubiquinone/menaquinone biosynthesis C-methylase UbiE
MASRELAAAFTDEAVARAYQHRPPYPAQVFDILEQLIVDRPRHVLDVGAGEGAIARPLAARVDRVDALDISAAMLAAGARRPGGRRPGLRWLLGAAETAELAGPYALVTAGASLHWMTWDTTLARLSGVLTPGGVLAIVDQGYHHLPWQCELGAIIARHSRSRDYDPGFSLPAELAARGLLQITGQARTGPVSFRQPVTHYVEQFHSTASLARVWMPAMESAAFDRAVAQAIAPYAVDGALELTVTASLTWGRPVVSPC